MLKIVSKTLEKENSLVENCLSYVSQVPSLPVLCFLFIIRKQVRKTKKNIQEQKHTYVHIKFQHNCANHK